MTEVLYTFYITLFKVFMTHKTQYEVYWTGLMKMFPIVPILSILLNTNLSENFNGTLAWDLRTTTTNGKVKIHINSFQFSSISVHLLKARSKFLKEKLSKNSKIFFFEKLYLLDVSIFEDTIFKSEK
jgi:hypothetical protein